MKLLRFILPALLFPAVAGYAQEVTSPRGTAVGGYLAVSDDAYGIDGNVAATSMGTTDLEISVVTAKHGGTDLRALTRPGTRHVFGFSHTPTIKDNDSFVRFPPSDVYPSSPGLRNYQTAVVGIDWGVGYGFRFNSSAAIGVDLKHYYFRNIPPGSRSYWSTSLSFYKQLTRSLSFGAVSRNTFRFKSEESVAVFHLGENNFFRISDPDVELTTTYNSPEWRLELGTALRLFDDRLLLAADVYSDTGYGFGSEWRVLHGTYLRMAMSHKLDLVYKKERVFGVAWGAGYHYGTVRFDIGYYFAYGGRDASRESTSFGLFDIDPGKNDALLLSALFFVN